MNDTTTDHGICAAGSPDDDLEARDRALLTLIRCHACPSQDELRDYYWRYLPSARYAEITEHLRTCSRCQAELGEYARIESDTHIIVTPD